MTSNTTFLSKKSIFFKAFFVGVIAFFIVFDIVWLNQSFYLIPVLVAIILFQIFMAIGEFFRIAEHGPVELVGAAS